MIAVTGAMGFIGSNLVRALVARGETVLAVDHAEPAAARRHLEDVPHVRAIDRHTFGRWLEAGESQVTELRAVFHQGACTDTTERRQDWLDEVNVQATLAVIRFCQDRGVPLIYASSAAIYGDRLGFREEPDCEHPINLYAESKRRIDDHVRAEVLPSPRAPVVGLRYFNVYGPREGHKGAMASVGHKMYHQLRDTGEVTLFAGSHGFGDGEQSRDFVYVDDVVDVNLWFLDHPEHSGIFNVGTGRAEPFNAFARAVLGHAGRGTLRYVPFPEGLRAQYQAFTQADLTRLRAVGYDRPLRDVAAGMASYLRWLDGAA